MLLFSFLWLNTMPPKPSIYDLKTSTPLASPCCCSCLFESNSSGPSSISSNTPDDHNDFYKPNDHIQNALLELARASPSTFKTLEQAGLVRRKIDEQGFCYEINCKWAELEAEFTTKMDKSQSNSKWFTIAGVVGSLLALGGSLYLSLGEDPLAGLILGLGSTAVSVVTSALDYIKAGTVDYAKRAMEKVTSACSSVRNMLPSYFQKAVNNSIKEGEETADGAITAQDDLKKIIGLIAQVESYKKTSCCSSECCDSGCSLAYNSALGKLHNCFCCEQDIDYEAIEQSPHVLEAIRQKLEENEKWWSSTLETIRSLSLVSGVVAPVFNAGSSALFLTTSLRRQAELASCWNISDSFNSSSAAVDAAFGGVKFANLGLSIVDVLIKVGLYIVQSRIDRINIQQNQFETFIEKLMNNEPEEVSPGAISHQFLQDLLESARSRNTSRTNLAAAGESTEPPLTTARRKAAAK